MYTEKLTERRNVANGKEWEWRHFAAVTDPQGIERGIVSLLRGWLAYADEHRAEFSTGIGEDGFLGPYWAEIGSNLLGMLSGSLGRLDGGTLDAVIRETMTAEGLDPDTL